MDSITIDYSNHVSPQNYFANALSLLKERQFKLAFQSIDAAIVFSGNSPFYIYQKMKMLYQVGAKNVCIQFIETQLEYLYKHASLYIVCRAIAYYQLLTASSNKALSAWLKSKNIPFCLADIYETLLTEKTPSFLAEAKKAFVQDHYMLCIGYLDLFLKHNAINKHIIYMKAHAYHMLGSLQEACYYYETYLRLAPNEAISYDYLGIIHMEMGHFDTALDYFNKSLQMDTEHTTSFIYHYAECAYSAKHFDVAISQYEHLIKTQPDDLQAYFNLLHIYKKLNKKLLARKYHNMIKKKLKSLTK